MVVDKHLTRSIQLDLSAGMVDSKFYLQQDVQLHVHVYVRHVSTITVAITQEVKFISCINDVCLWLRIK